MPESLRFPLPNTRLGDSIVVASCYYRELMDGDRAWMDPEDDWPDVVFLVLLLNPTSPYFTVAHTGYVNGKHSILASESHFNIVDVVKTYEDWGGDT